MNFRLFSSKRHKHLYLLLLSFLSLDLMGGETEVTFTSTGIIENSPGASSVGFFGVSNPDQNKSYEFQLLQVTPSSGESSFELESNGSLLTARSLDYESSPEYSITIGLDSSGGDRLVRSFDVSVINQPEILGLFLSNNRLPENEENYSVGFLTAITDDNNQDANLSYQIVQDDGNFSIFGDWLVALSEFDYEQTQQQTLQLRVSATGYQSLEKNFSIEIDDKYEKQAPSDLKFFSVGISENGQAGELLGTLLGIDSDRFETLTYALGSNEINSDVNVRSNGSVFANRPFDFEANQTVTFSAEVKDTSGEVFEKEFSLEVHDDPSDNNRSLEPLGGISGRVVDIDGLPIDYFEILAYDANDTRAHPLPVHTKLIVHEDGDYDLKIMPGRFRLYLTGAHRSHPSYQAFKPASFSEGEIEISENSLHLTRKDWVLEPLTHLSGSSDTLLEVNGTVVDDAGNPLEGIAIEVKDSDGGSFKYPVALAITGRDGRFAMHLESGSYHFRVNDYEGMWMQQSLFEQVIKGIPIKDLDFELKLRSRMKVSGHLMTTQGIPANAKLSFWNWENETQVFQSVVGSHDLATGHYLYELPLGKYLIKASDRKGIFKDSWYGGQAREQARFVEGESNGSRIENIDLIMVEQPSAELLITYKIGELPVSRPPVLEVTTDISGNFSEEVSFFPVGEATGILGQFSYQMKSESVRLSILPLLSSKPISKIESEALSEKKLLYDFQEDAWFYHPSMPTKTVFHPVSGKIDLILDLSEFDEFMQGSLYDQPDSNNSENSLSSSSLSTVSGSVLSSDGSFLAYAKVEARNYDTGIIHVGGTDGTGHFVFDELSAGNWSFFASPPDGAGYRLMADSNHYDLEIAASTAYSLSISLKHANLIGQATFVDASGIYQKPKLGWCWVVPRAYQTETLGVGSSSGYYINLDKDGRFGMHLPQGKYDLTLELFSKSGQSRQKNFSFEIFNPNKVMVLGERFSVSWPKMDGASQYSVQKESNFNGHYETLETFDGDKSSGSFVREAFSDYRQKYRILAKAKHKYNSMSLVEKYIAIKAISSIGTLQEEAKIYDSNASSQVELEEVPVYALSSFDLEQLSGDQNLTPGDYSILERFDEDNRSIGVFIEPVEEIVDPIDFSVNKDKQYALSIISNDSIPTDRTYYEDQLLYEPDVSIGFPLIEFAISEFEIRGVVYDQNGTLLSGVEVFAFDLWNDTLLRTVSDDTGRYSLSVGPGSWEVEVGSISDAFRLEKGDSNPITEFEIPNVPLIGKKIVNVNSTETLENVDFMVNLEAELVLVLGQFKLLSSSDTVDLQGYEAEVRLVSERGEFITKVEDNGSFSISIPKGFYEVFPWVDSRSGTYPEYELSHQKTGVYDSYEISSPYFSMSIPSDLNSSIEPMVVHLGQADAQVQGFVKDLDGLPIPGAVVTALSDLGELLIRESDYLGSFQFAVRGNAYWTIQCDFIYSDLLDGNRYQTPHYQRFWLNPNEQKDLEFVVRKSKNQINGSVGIGGVASSNYFGREAYLKKTDLWGNEIIVAKSLIDAQGDFSFQVPEGERLLGQLDSSLTIGVLADWTGVLPTIEPYEIKNYPFSDGSSNVILSNPLNQIINYSVKGQFLRDGKFEGGGWVGEVFAVSMTSQSAQRVESDMRVTNIAEDGSFSLSLSPGSWSIDYRITHAAGQTRGFEPSLSSPLFITIGTSSNSLEPFDLITESSESNPHLLKINLFNPSQEKIMGLCHLDLVPHNSSEDKRTFSSNRTTLRVTEGVIEHELATQGMYDLWVFPGPQLREEGYYMPKPFVAWVDGQTSEVTITIPKGDKNLDLSAVLSGKVLGLDGEPVKLESNNFYKAPVVWITSSTGLFSWAYCEWDGSFVFREIPQNLEWYAGSSYFDPFLGKDFATLSDQGPFLSGAEEIVLRLDDFSGATPMPEETSEFFDPWSNFQMLLPDGLEILIPKGAIPVEPHQRTVRIVVSPNLAHLPRDLLSVPVGYGYKLSLFDEKGKLIENQFRKKVKMTIPVNSFFLQGMKLQLADIEVAYFDHTFNSWRPQPNQVLETEAQAIHLLVDHFSTWVSIANAGTHLPVPVPLGESAQAIGETFWYKHDWFGEFYAMPNSKWIFHAEHGWLYVEEPNENEIWAFDSKLKDWLWTSSEIFSNGSKHHFFSNKWSGYLWHSPKSVEPRLFFDYDANAWFTDEIRFSVNLDVDNPSFGTVTGGGIYREGFSPLLTAYPKYGYSFDGWAGGVTSQENEIQLNPLSRGTSLQARFSKIPPLQLSVGMKGEGTGFFEGGGSYEFGARALLTAEGGDRSIFMGWWENGEKISWDKKIIIPMEKQRTLKAQFEPATIDNILRVRYAQ